MILIIPSSSPTEATLPLHGQANGGPEGHLVVFSRSEGKSGLQVSESRRWVLSSDSRLHPLVDLRVPQTNAPKCPNGPGRGRQRSHPPVSRKGGDIHTAFPPGCCTSATNTMPGPAKPSGLCLLPRSSSLGAKAELHSGTGHHTLPCTLPSSHGSPHCNTQGPGGTCRQQLGLDTPLPQRGGCPGLASIPTPD